MSFRGRALSLWQFIKILKVEPYLFIMIFQIGLKMTPDSQMIQDKICVQWYNTTDSYCRDLPSTKESDSEPGHYKSHILADAAQFGAYHIYITTLPSIIWALFIGAWVDRYTSARKWIIIIFSLCSIVEDLILIYLTLSWETSVYTNLGVQLPTLLLVGGGSGPRIAITHYMTTTTPPDLMAIRFMLFQLCFTLAIPMGAAVGGYILVQEPAFSSGQIRNFTMCHIIALVFEVVAVLWIVFMVNEKATEKPQTDIIEMKDKKVNDQGVVNTTKSDNNNDQIETDKNIHPLLMLFDLDNVKSMFRALIKKRPNKVRRQLFWLLLSLGIVMGEGVGMMVLGSNFIQKVYLWTPDWTAYMNSISMVMSSLGTMLIIPIFSKILGVDDIPLALFGFLLILVNYIIKGLWLHPGAHYLTMVIGAFCGTSGICSKSYLAKIVEKQELGRIMSFLVVLDCVTPIIFITFLTHIFRLTIDTYPGTVFLVLAFFMIVPILSSIWIIFFTERPLDVKQSDHAHKEICA